MISLDFETSGLDLFHGARPFAVVWCAGDSPECREWEVSPYDRSVKTFHKDVTDLRNLIRKSDRIVFHNSRFDCRCLETLGIDPPWEKFEDTLIASHVLYSAPPHNLTHLTREYLREDVTPWEKSLETAVKKCRSMVSRARLKEKRGKTPAPELLPIRTWRITEEGDPEIPSANGQDGLWHSDYWLPGAMFRHDPDSVPPEFGTVLRDYALVDAVTTYRLWKRMEVLLRERGLWKVYRAKLETVPAAYRMEKRGMTVDAEVFRRKQVEYTEEVTYLSEVLVGVADSMNYALELPKGTTNHCLDDFVFGRAPRPEGKRDAKLPRVHAPDTLNLPVADLTDSGAPSFGSDARDVWLADLEPGTKARLFVESFSRWSELGKGLSYLSGYERFLLPIGETDDTHRDGPVLCSGVPVLQRTGVDLRGTPARISPGDRRGTTPGEVPGTPANDAGVCVIHPSFDPVGTVTTRMSSQNPNAQNISQRSAVNLRECFGPGPGREWYSFDAAGIELIIPAKLADEREILDVMLNPDRPPYFGSYHLLIFSILHPDLWAKHGVECKSLFAGAEYTDTKGFNFARQYGAQKKKADATARVKGASDLVGQRFPAIDRLSREVVARAGATGRVFTVPDAAVDPERGYPIVCRRNEYDRISPTVPFAYFVSGTAGWWMGRALVKCDRLMETWRRDEGYDGHLIATVHDEIVTDVPVLRTVERIVSGGQTGADQAGLRAGRLCGRETGGYIGRGFRTLEGPAPELSSFGLEEVESHEYPVRTRMNVESSDATIRFATDFGSAGEKCTLGAIRGAGKPYLDVNPNSPRPASEVLDWCRKNRVKTLNVAGNSESTSPGIGAFTEKFLRELLTADNDNLPRVRELRDAMQSCGDEMGIPTPVSCERHPKNWAVGEKVK